MNNKNIPSQPPPQKRSLLTRSFHLRIPHWVGATAWALLAVAIIVAKVKQHAELSDKWASPDRPSIARFEATKKIFALQEELLSEADLVTTLESTSRSTLKLQEKNSPYRAANLNFLANVYAAQGDKEKAAPLYEESQRLLKKYLGAEHPDVLIVEENRRIAQSE